MTLDLNKIANEWSYRVGVIDIKNKKHIYHLNNILNEQKVPYDVIDEVINSLTEVKLTKKALQQSQSRTYAQNVTEPVEEEEDIPFLIKFLGDVVLGVAEQYPAAKLEAQKRQEAYNRGVRQGEETQRIRCNNQRGNC